MFNDKKERIVTPFNKEAEKKINGFSAGHTEEFDPDTLNPNPLFNH